MTAFNILETGLAFITALSDRDFKQLQQVFHEDVQFRALMPAGVRGSIGVEETMDWLYLMFGDADEFQILNSSAGLVADRLHIAYRLRLHRNREWQIIEQQAYCIVSEGRITVMNMVGSGFRPDFQVQANSYAIEASIATE